MNPNKWIIALAFAVAMPAYANDLANEMNADDVARAGGHGGIVFREDAKGNVEAFRADALGAMAEMGTLTEESVAALATAENRLTAEAVEKPENTEMSSEMDHDTGVEAHYWRRRCYNYNYYWGYYARPVFYYVPSWFNYSWRFNWGGYGYYNYWW